MRPRSLWTSLRRKPLDTYRANRLLRQAIELLFADGDDLQRLRLVKEIAFAPGQPPTQRLLAICRAGDHLFLRSRYRRD